MGKVLSKPTPFQKAIVGMGREQALREVLELVGKLTFDIQAYVRQPLLDNYHLNFGRICPADEIKAKLKEMIAKEN